MKEFIVQINKNNHIILNGSVIAVLGQWNKYQDLIESSKDDRDTLINQIKKRNKENGKTSKWMLWRGIEVLW